MAESFNGLYKWELVYPQGPWRGLDDVEFLTMTYVDWFNHRRLHGEITDDLPDATSNTRPNRHLTHKSALQFARQKDSPQLTFVVTDLPGIDPLLKNDAGAV